jgi:hypothetical protein
VGEVSQLFSCLLFGLDSARGYIELIIVEIEVKHRDDYSFEIVFKVLELLELLIYFRHLFEKQSCDVIFVFHLGAWIITTLLKSGLRRETPSSPSCSSSTGRFLTIWRLIG